MKPKGKTLEKDTYWESRDDDISVGKSQKKSTSTSFVTEFLHRTTIRIRNLGIDAKKRVSKIQN